jgi:hypothetical protein
MADPSMTCRIYVAGLDGKVTVPDMRGYFEKFGELTDCYIPKNHQTGGLKHFGFVTFAAPESAQECLGTTTHEINGQSVELRPCVAKDQMAPKANGNVGGAAAAPPPLGMVGGAVAPGVGLPLQAGIAGMPGLQGLQQMQLQQQQLQQQQLLQHILMTMQQPQQMQQQAQMMPGLYGGLAAGFPAAQGAAQPFGLAAPAAADPSIAALGAAADPSIAALGSAVPGAQTQATPGAQQPALMNSAMPGQVAMPWMQGLQGLQAQAVPLATDPSAQLQAPAGTIPTSDGAFGGAPAADAGANRYAPY